MKRKFLLLGLAALLTAGGLWAGRITWRARHQLVTLNVRNRPLAEVLHQLERQTWKTIRAEQALDARITLHVQDKPLDYVLDRIAEQAGAHWSSLFAVYTSTSALRSLQSALATNGKLEPAGWTKIAPNLPEMDQPDSPDLGPGGAGPVVRSGPAEGAGPMPERPRMMMMARRTQDGPVVFMGGPDGRMEVWSPEELVIESPLTKRLGNEHNEPPTPEAAAEIARKVNGQWTTCFALRKSTMGIGFAGPPRPGSDPLKRNPNDRFARLTPEQRVLRARDRMGLEPVPTPP